MIEEQTANILIVDDEPDIGRIISTWLTNGGVRLRYGHHGGTGSGAIAESERFNSSSVTS